MDRVKLLRKQLTKVSPVHDYPVGLIHPYWARKPFNVVKEIIKCLTDEGDRIADPFMGSGTVLFSALSEGRSVLGSDLNPLAVFIVMTVLGLRELKVDAKYEAKKYLNEVSDCILQWYKVKGYEGYMERERFNVNGQFEYGQFSLHRFEIVTKTLKKGKWTKRKVLHEGARDVKYTIDQSLIDDPLNFTTIKLMYNSRIAVPRGATLDQFYTRENIAAINALLRLANKKGLSREVRNLRKLLLSSSLPLLRLSDKKASSQWPYWRPKQVLTSRNPVMVLKSRVDSMLTLIDWMEDFLPNVESSSPQTLRFSDSMKSECTVMRKSCQDLATLEKHRAKYDLVLTDPPYSDHVPYLEYSALWTSILGLPMTKKSLRQEIVRSDAPERRQDSAEYSKRLRSGFNTCCRLLKRGGLLAWFYQDIDLRQWRELWAEAQSNQMSILDIIPIQKQRRSMKTVTTPKRTLDGDLLCVFEKDHEGNNGCSGRDYNAALEHLRETLRRSQNPAGYFDKYSIIVRTLLMSGDIDVLAEKYLTINNIMKALKE